MNHLVRINFQTQLRTEITQAQISYAFLPLVLAGYLKQEEVTQLKRVGRVWLNQPGDDLSFDFSGVVAPNFLSLMRVVGERVGLLSESAFICEFKSDTGGPSLNADLYWGPSEQSIDQIRIELAVSNIDASIAEVSDIAPMLSKQIIEKCVSSGAPLSCVLVNDDSGEVVPIISVNMKLIPVYLRAAVSDQIQFLSIIVERANSDIGRQFVLEADLMTSPLYSEIKDHKSLFERPSS